MGRPSTGIISRPSIATEDLHKMRSAVRPIFDKIDADRSGSISGVEMVTIVRELNMDLKPEDIRALMRDADPDCSGAVDFEEFCEALARQNGALAAVTSEASTFFGFLNPFSWFGPSSPRAPATPLVSPQSAARPAAFSLTPSRLRSRSQASLEHLGLPPKPGAQRKPGAQNFPPSCFSQASVSRARSLSQGKFPMHLLMTETEIKIAQREGHFTVPGSGPRGPQAGTPPPRYPYHLTSAYNNTTWC